MVAFMPTAEQRSTVQLMAGYRIPQDEMVLLIINPRTGKHIDETTLRKVFASELKTGFTHLRTRIMAATVRNALGDKDHQGNITAQIWLGKTLYGMREQVAVELPKVTEDTNEEIHVAARRIAFTLAMGASIAQKKPKVPA